MSNSCSCVLKSCLDGDDVWQIILSRWTEVDEEPGARCSECENIFDEFRLEVYLDNNSALHSFAICRDCFNIREALSCSCYPAIGSLWSSIDEMFEEALLNREDVTIPEDVLSELDSSETRNILIEYMEQHWTALDVLYRCIDDFSDKKYFAFPEHELSQVEPSTREYLLGEIENQWAAMEKLEAKSNA